MSDTDVSVDGHCYCGAIQFTVTIPQGDKPLFPPSYCHCDSCRRAHAAPLYHVVAIDGAKHLEITAGEEHVVKYAKPTNDRLTRCFCGVCGTRLFNEFNPDLPFWPEECTKPMAFFPNTLKEETVQNLPEICQAKRHNCPNECVLHWELLNAIRDDNNNSKN